MINAFYEELDALHPNTENYVLTVLDGPHFGEKALTEDHKLKYSCAAADGSQAAAESAFFAANAAEAAAVAESGITEIAGVRVYAELLGQEKKLVVLGGGHVAIAVIRLGKMIGMRVICIEDRPSFAENARQAGADEVVCETFETALGRLDSDPDTFFVIVTRGHQYDTECLRIAAGKPHAYIGLMGSRRRVRMVREKLAAEGVDRQVLSEVYTPIGLDIGGETPEEIAVSIAAEIIEVKNRKKRNFGYPRDILDGILAADEAAGRRVLATIVTRKGSAPRQVGTKMLILPDGLIIGTIGGGCVEAEVVREARALLLGEQPGVQLYHVDLTNDAAAKEGMVCGGILDVLLERV